MSLWAGVGLYYLLLIGLPIAAIVLTALSIVKKEKPVVIGAIVTTVLAIMILIYYRYRFRIQDSLRK